jgi:hypothetical protein
VQRYGAQTSASLASPTISAIGIERTRWPSTGTGDVYVAGSLLGETTGSEFAVVKLDGETGEERWRRTLPEPPGFPSDVFHQAGATALTTEAGDVIAVGQTGDAELGMRVAVVRWNAASGSDVVGTDARSCQGYIGRAAARLFSRRMSALRRCWLVAAEGELDVAPSDCRDDPMVRDAVASKAGRFRAGVAARCPAGIPDDVSCASDVDGLLTPDGNGGCLGEAHRRASEELAAMHSLEAHSDPGSEACRRTILSRGQNMVGGAIGAWTRCRSFVELGQLRGSPGCEDVTALGTILRRIGTSFHDRIGIDCSGDHLAPLGLCAVAADQIAAADGFTGCLLGRYHEIAAELVDRHFGDR